jgi:SAM-dependent methyltransferase
LTSTVHIETCQICGLTGPGGLLDGALGQCGSCGFAWTRADIGPSAELYDSSYFGGGGYDDYFQPTARRFESRLRVRWLLRTGPVSSLVEAGSAAGFFVEAARAAGIDAQGVEVCESAARFARDHLGVPVRHGDFESIDFSEPFDAVCAFHVLEHVEDPHEFLEAALAAVRPGGRLAIEVPNIASAAARRLGPAWQGLQLRYHRWHFSPDSLIRLVSAHGFEVVRQDTTVFRSYMPVRYRWRHARHILPADLIDLRSSRLTHPDRADLIRLVARRPTTGTSA